MTGQQGFRIYDNTQVHNGKINHIIITLFAVLGAVLSMLLTFDDKPNWWIVIPSIMAGIGLASVSDKRAKQIIWIVLTLCTILWLTVFREYFKSGFFQIVNNGIALYNYNTGNELYYYTLPTGVDTAIAYQTLSAYFIILVGMLFEELLEHKKIAVFVLLNVMFMLVILYFENSQAGIAGMFSCMAIPAAVIWSNCKEQSEKSLAICLMGCLCIGCLLGGWYLLKGNYNQNLTVAKMKAQAVKRTDAFLYGEQDAPEGNLQKAASFQGSSDVKLKVTASERELYYLKGYVGGEYSGGVWNAIDEASYSGEFQGLFSWLNEKDFAPLAQNSSYIQLRNQLEPNAFAAELVEIRVENISANCRYLYVPYGITWDAYSEFKNVNKDMNIFDGDKEDSLQRYSVWQFDVAAAFSEENPAWMNQAEGSEEINAFREAQAEYRAFVYDNYLNVEKEMQDYLEEELQTLRVNGYVTTTNTIRDWLEDVTTISEDYETKDYLLYFMEGSKKGNASFYASAATLMYRYYGIPARYVEGYMADLRTADEQSGQYKKELTGNDVHAWVEIYKDGIGWIPIEVTPGYYEDLKMNQSSMLQEVELPEEWQPEEEQQQPPQVQRKKVISAMLWILAVLVVILAVCIFVLMLRRWILCKRRNCILKQGSLQERMECLLPFMRKLLLFQGKEEDVLSKNIVEVIQRYRFADGRMQEEEWKLVLDYALEMQETVYQSMRLKQKWSMKYIWGLI